VTDERVQAGTERHAVGGESIVEAVDLAGGYGTKPVWSGATFDVGEGEFVAVLGPNGAGKSTLIKMLLGLIQPLSGSLSVLGSRPRRGSPAIGYVPQVRTFDTAGAFSGSDIVGLGLDGHRWGFRLPTRARRSMTFPVEEALAAVGASEYAHRRVGEMSGGERQRLLIAQALVSKPRLLLLDEPFVNLDMHNQALLAELVGHVAKSQRLAVMLVAHDVNPIRTVVDRVCYIARGSVAIGTPEEVVTGPVLSRLYGGQVEVLTDSRGRRFVVGLEDEAAHPHPATTLEEEGLL
jgi:zinc/manganese transport system ATP-binding protein